MYILHELKTNSFLPISKYQSWGMIVQARAIDISSYINVNIGNKSDEDEVFII